MKLMIKDYNGVINDCTIAIEDLDCYIEAYNTRAMAKLSIKDTAGACYDWSRVRECGSKEAEKSIIKYCK